jgi:hypothetical protein
MSSQYQKATHTATAAAITTTSMTQAQTTGTSESMSAFTDYFDATIPSSIPAQPFPQQHQVPLETTAWDSIAGASEPWLNHSLPVSAEAAFFDPQSLNAALGLSQSSNLSMIDDRWMIFMRDSGIFDAGPTAQSFDYDPHNV